MEEMPVVDGPVGDFHAVRVGPSDHRLRLDPASSEHDRPRLAPVVASVVSIDARRAAKLGHDDDERALEKTALGEIRDQRREALVELAELLDVEVEVLVVRVVVAVVHLNESHIVLDQASSEQAVTPEVVIAVLLLDARRFARRIENVLSFHQPQGLDVRVCVGVGGRGAAAKEEAIVDLPAELLSARVGRFADGRRARDVRRGFSASEHETIVLGAEISRISGRAATAGA